MGGVAHNDPRVYTRTHKNNNAPHVKDPVVHVKVRWIMDLFIYLLLAYSPVNRMG